MSDSSSPQNNKERVLRSDLTSAIDDLSDPTTDTESKAAALRAMIGLSIEFVDATEKRHAVNRELLESLHRED